MLDFVERVKENFEGGVIINGNKHLLFNIKLDRREVFTDSNNNNYIILEGILDKEKVTLLGYEDNVGLRLVIDKDLTYQEKINESLCYDIIISHKALIAGNK